MIESPCNKVCVVPDGLDYCIGCGRTLNEIATWMQLTDADRLRVIELARDRLHTHQADALHIDSTSQ
ncbi:MAG: DUF1289 domain-containing protein [Gammaproteobacteria bacterium]